jgi:hypothetical protein
LDQALRTPGKFREIGSELSIVAWRHCCKRFRANLSRLDTHDVEVESRMRARREPKSADVGVEIQELLRGGDCHRQTSRSD